MSIVSIFGAANSEDHVFKPPYIHRLGRCLVPWPSPTARSRQWKASHALKIYIAVWVIVLAWKAVPHGLGVNVRIGAAALVIDAIMLIAVLSVRRSGSITARDLGLRRVAGARSVGYTLLALIALMSFDLLSSTALPSTGVNPFIGVSSQSTLNILLAGIAACCSAPVIEELFFRGFIYRSLRNRLPVLAAAPIVGFMFGAMHVGPYPLATLPFAAFFGVVACLLYERIGSLLPGIILHSLIDSRSFEVGISGTDRLAIIIALIITATLLVSPVVRACWRFVNGEPILREYKQTSEAMVM